MPAEAFSFKRLQVDPFADAKTVENASQLSSSRLSYALFTAIGLHVLLLFGTGFKLSLNPYTNSSIEITLATHNAKQAPENADFLAQYHQDGSGSEKEAKAITTESLSEFEKNTINEVSDQHARRSDTRLAQENTLNTTQVAEERSVSRTNYQERQVESSGDSFTDVEMSREVASLKAKLDQQRQAYAKRPRVRRLTSVSTRASDDAQYLLDWSQQVEVVGNRNYPKQALSKGIHGELRLLAVLDANGALIKAEVLNSSGHALLDDAALNIVHKAAPYAPFPPSIRKNTDHIEIIRTWRFEISGLSTR